MTSRAVCILSLLLLAEAGLSGSLRAQDEAIIDDLASVLMLEDQRRFDEPVFRALAGNATVMVRRWAARAMGRIGDPRAVPLLDVLLLDPDTTVQGEAAFALGMIGSSEAVPRLVDIVRRAVGARKTSLHVEAVGALARIADTAVVSLFDDMLVTAAGLGRDRTDPVVDRMLIESWRLGPNAPVDRLLPFAQSPNSFARWAVLYTLSQLEAPSAREVLLTALDDAQVDIRRIGVRVLRRPSAERIGIDAGTAVTALRQLVLDPDWLVRVEALAGLASYADPGLEDVAIDGLSDPSIHVRVEAARTLGVVGGPRAGPLLRSLLEGTRFAVRQAAVVALAARQDSTFDVVASGWAVSADWRERIAIARAAALRDGAIEQPWFGDLAGDVDGRVRAAALETFVARRPSDDADLMGLVARALDDPDVVVRTIGAGIVERNPAPEFVDQLVRAFEQGTADRIPDARLAALEALAAIASGSDLGGLLVASRFLDAVPTPMDYLTRRVAAARFPEAAARWGPAEPIAARRRLADYRELIRRFGLVGNTSAPQLTIEIEHGDLLVQLNPEEAPLTIDNLMRLVERRYFDGQIWNRVVPGFVIQAGDPRGDGWGGPGFVMRDEVARSPFESGSVGMATSGPDTGGSQFFITFAREPRLDGAYTPIGRVVAGLEMLELISEGERIRRIRP